MQPLGTTYFTINAKIYPVFKPNDYFWKHHWSPNSGEEKWQAYARVIREEIMAKSYNFKLYDISAEDKVKFKKIMQGKTIKE